jgi:uncharacterized membrane protein HdeD (DUF308 family)
MVDELQAQADSAAEELKPMCKDWLWYILLGIGLILLGTLAISMAPFTTLAVAKVFGIVLIVAGAIQTVTAFWSSKWSGLLLQLLLGVFYIVVGVLATGNPAETAAAFALLMAAFFFVGGLFRIVASLHLRFPNWGWSLFSGFISLILGIIIWTHFPCSIVLVGIFVGVEIIFNGWAWVMLGATLRALRKTVQE